MIDVNQYRAAVRKGKITDLHEIISKALELDARLEAVADDPPPEFQYYVLRTESDIAYRGTYHVYFDLLTANLWNSVRVFRILLHEQIREALLKGFAAKPPVFTQAMHTAQLQRSTDACYELQAGILASVPQHLGYVNHTSIRDLSSPAIWSEGTLNRETKGSFGVVASPDITQLGLSNVAIECSPPSDTSGFSPKNSNPSSIYELAEVPDVRASGGYNLMWPLWLAGAMDLVTEEAQVYAAKSLRRIGQEMGIQQANMLAQIVESKSLIEVWEEKDKFEIVEEG